MKLDVYDTYVQTSDGKFLHFDVLVPEGAADKAVSFARQWLDEIKVSYMKLDQENCRFCHSETSLPEVAHQVRAKGYFILQMEGCPSPV